VTTGVDAMHPSAALMAGIVWKGGFLAMMVAFSKNSKKDRSNGL
jgi:hypothetical protein